MRGKVVRISVRVVCALLAVLLPVTTWAANQLEGVRIWPSPDQTRVVLDLVNKPDYKWFRLSNPERLVIDLKTTKTRFKASGVKSAGLVKGLRTGKQKNGTLRVVVELQQAASPKLFSLPPTDPYGHRLVVDLAEKDRQETPEPPPLLKRDPDVIIAIDAGHGGDDPGSIGPKKTFEKHLTLEMSRRLLKLVDAAPGMRGVLIRRGDYYVNLNRRTELARKAQADMMVSIHADAFTSPRPRGGSVWVLSNRRANTEIGRWMEKQDKRSEILGGAGTVDLAGRDKDLSRTLLDMSMNYSMAQSFDLAQRVLDEMGRVTTLHKKAPEHASLAVLKAPDFPSILIEVGFISNPTEEKLLRTRSHQEKVVNAIFRGIKRYVYSNPPEGSLIAQRQNEQPQKHVVRRGESLSLLAQRYNVSVNQLKQANKLNTSTIRIGQELLIPL